MRESLDFFIDGAWVAPGRQNVYETINPATEAVSGRISLGSALDVDRAVKAARAAFQNYARWSRAERIELLTSIVAELKTRQSDLAEAIVDEIGAPLWLAQSAQAPLAVGHFKAAIEALETYAFRDKRGSTLIVKEPIGVSAFITPWNWPLNQIASKVAPALATGCAIVLKPSELAPFSARIFAEALAAAGTPQGVFNLVYGDGRTVGSAISAHSDIDMVSVTGSTRTGVDVALAAAPSVKRVCQELGGKCSNIILADADLEAAVVAGVRAAMINSGQSCNAPSRMLAPRARIDEVVNLAKIAAEATTVGDPKSSAHLGPVVSLAQWTRVQQFIQSGLEEGAALVAGGLGRPGGFARGYYVKPTVFADVSRSMTIARQEIFGPLLAIQSYESIEEAIEIANDTEYGLAAYVSGKNPETAMEVASRLRVGQVVINHAKTDLAAPFGGYKASGNGRECGAYAFAEFLETKSILGAS